MKELSATDAALVTALGELAELQKTIREMAERRAWKTIATAEHIDTPILLFDGVRRSVGWWSDYGWYAEAVWFDVPTHWTHLPAAPVGVTK